MFSGREVSAPGYSRCPLPPRLAKPLTLTWQPDSLLARKQVAIAAPSHYFEQIFAPPFLTRVCLSLSLLPLSFPVAVGVQIKLELLQRKFWAAMQQVGAPAGTVGAVLHHVRCHFGEGCSETRIKRSPK